MFFYSTQRRQRQRRQNSSKQLPKFPVELDIGVIWNILSFCPFPQMIDYLPYNSIVREYTRGNCLFFHRGPIEEQMEIGEQQDENMGKCWTPYWIHYVANITHLDLIDYDYGDLSPFLKFNHGKQTLKRLRIFGIIDDEIASDIIQLIETRTPKNIELDNFKILQAIPLTCIKVLIKNGKWWWDRRFLIGQPHKIEFLELIDINFEKTEEEEEEETITTLHENENDQMEIDTIEENENPVLVVGVEIPRVLIRYSAKFNHKITKQIIDEIYTKFNFEEIIFKDCIIDCANYESQQLLKKCNYIEFNHCKIQSMEWNLLTMNREIKFNSCHFIELKRHELTTERRVSNIKKGSLNIIIRNDKNWVDRLWLNHKIKVNNLIIHHKSSLTHENVGFLVKFMNQYQINERICFNNARFGIFQNVHHIVHFLNNLMFFKGFVIESITLIGRYKSKDDQSIVEYTYNVLKKVNKKIKCIKFHWILYP